MKKVKNENHNQPYSVVNFHFSNQLRFDTIIKNVVLRKNWKLLGVAQMALPFGELRTICTTA